MIIFLIYVQLLHCPYFIELEYIKPIIVYFFVSKVIELDNFVEIKKIYYKYYIKEINKLLEKYFLIGYYFRK